MKDFKVGDTVWYQWHDKLVKGVIKAIKGKVIEVE